MTNRFLIFTAVGLLAQSISCWATTKVEIDPEKTIEIVLSHEDINRFSVEDGVIVDTVSDANQLKAKLHPKTGSAFVSIANKQVLEKPVSFSLTTGCGEIQTFVVSTREGAGELVILQSAPSKEKEENPLTTDYHSNTIELLNCALAGHSPEGYGERELHTVDLLGVPSPLTSKAVKAFEGPFDTLFLFEISNPSRRPASISTNALKREGDLWVFLSKTTLIPGEKVPCLIATKKEF